MSPRSLTEQEKNIHAEKLLAKGRELLAAYGVRKTSVEDIAKAAGIAKGSFYQYFDSKEAFLFELIVQFHNEWFSTAEKVITAPSAVPLRERIREYIWQSFHSPEFLFIFKYHEEITELLEHVQSLSPKKVDALMALEHNTYAKLLELCQIDTQKVKPGVIHNYLHTVYTGISNVDIMEKDCIDDTFEALLSGLILYAFGGGL